ncbi:MAG TPA: hypothetical protein VFH68_05320 [Polyangia bacterium]|jgi:hypothetical protein|nr:hypothetical protein [Polyangia bacterium]
MHFEISFERRVTLAALAIALGAGLWPQVGRAAPAGREQAPPMDIPELEDTPPPARRPAPAPPPPVVGPPPPAWYQPLRPDEQAPAPAERQSPPPDEGTAAPTTPVWQRRDREDPRLRRTNPPPRPINDQTPQGAAPAPRERPPLPPYLITSTTPPSREPGLKDVAPDSAAASQRNRLTSPPPKSNVGEIIRRAQSNISFYELVDEILDEITYQLGKQDAMALSPMAIRMVRLSPDLRPEFAATLEARLLARLGGATNIRTVVCIECTAMRSRVENGQWLVTLGAVRTEDLQRIGRSQGIKTFVDLGFTYSPSSNQIWVEAVAFRASDGGIVWSDAYRSDATTAMLLRSGRRIPSRAERLDELEHKLSGRPYYGYMVGVGLARIGYNGPTGDIQGPLMTIRIHERFGADQAQLFGLSVGIFFTGVPEAGKNVLNSLMSGAYYSVNLSEPSLNGPELWYYGELGGMFSGNQGNTFYGETGVDLHLKWRFSMVGGLQYLLPTHFADHDLGGLGYRLRLALNW